MTYGADGLLNDVKGFYVRKRSADRDVNAIARYVYDMLAAKPAFGDRVRVYAVKVWESPRSCAAYMPEV